jgi:hypothetical protein
MEFIPKDEDFKPHITDANGSTVAIFETIESDETGRLFAAAPALLAVCEAVLYFWGRDPEAFGDDASVTSLAGKFAAIAAQCRAAIAAARGGG